MRTSRPINPLLLNVTASTIIRINTKTADTAPPIIHFFFAENDYTFSIFTYYEVIYSIRIVVNQCVVRTHWLTQLQVKLIFFFRNEYR